MRETLDEAGLRQSVDFKEAAIWLYGEAAPQAFDLEPSRRLVQRFLAADLPAILTQPIEQVGWHLFYRCELCEFYRYCREEAERTQSVSLLPHLSPGGRRYLREASWGGEPVHTIEQFYDLVRAPDTAAVNALLAPCGNLRGRRVVMRNRMESLLGGQVVKHTGVVF